MTDRLADFAHLHMPLALTMGDPAGVGGEIGLQAWLRRRSGVPPFFAIDDPVRLARLGHDLGFEVPICTIAHPLLLLKRKELKGIVDAVAKVKENAAELAAPAKGRGRPRKRR